MCKIPTEVATLTTAALLHYTKFYQCEVSNSDLLSENLYKTKFVQSRVANTEINKTLGSNKEMELADEWLPVY
ncbi:hypothetical protein [Piscirickettsia salmonis]|uniref:hypothetical protein n=1 Tax=Piscirickettsia salmonis TaxID=1238 RepID=UPI0012BAEE77|nr:hypothetical protein [Piscirickettsia salmonis]